MKLTEEKINTNFLTFINYLKRYNCYSDTLIDELGEKIKYASYSLEEQYGGCYDGSLVDVTLNILCRYGFMINENVFGGETQASVNSANLDNDMYVNQSSLIRVLLLLNLSKAEMFVKQTEDWARKKGKLYQFNDKLDTSLKLGARTLFLCQKYGIVLNEEEYNAISSIDKEDEIGSRFQTPLFTIVNAAKNMTLVKLRKEYLKNIKVETKEL